MASSKATVMLLLAAAVVSTTTTTTTTTANKAPSSTPKLPDLASSSLLAAAPPKPPASATCVTSLLDLSPCLPFFKDAKATAAPAGCCEGLRAIVGSQALCLCHIVDHSLERAIGVDIPIDRAFRLLRDVCSLALPPEVVTSCGDKGKVPPLYICPAPSA